MAVDSKSLIKTAICARLAASATKLKSRKKGDVVSIGFCAGGGCCIWGADVGAFCVEEEEEAKYEWLVL